MKWKAIVSVGAMAVLTGCHATPEEVGVKATKRETLGRHETVAEFQGVSEHTCRGMTALCPDRCGHSGRMATFEIIEYIQFDKLSEYGKKQETFSFLLEDNLKNMKVDQTIYDAVVQLVDGDRVFLSWNHDYVTKNGASGPERPIIKLEKMNDQPGKE